MGGTEDMPGRAQRSQRTAVMWGPGATWKYHKLQTFERAIADVVTVPASILFGRKHPAGEDHPISGSAARTTEVEDQMGPANTQLPLFPPRL